MIKIHDPVSSTVGKLSQVKNVNSILYAPKSSTFFSSGRTDDPASQMGAMSQVGTLFSIINRISTKVAAQDWHLHRDARGMVCEECGQENVTNVISHPALSVWNTPNDFYTQGELVESLQQHIDLTGEAYLVVLKFGSRPIQLWPIRPDRMTPVKAPAPNFLTGWVYASPDGDQIPLGRDEVIQLRMPNPLDPYRGMGPVQTLLHQIYGLKYSAQYNSAFFRNSAQPGGAIEYPDGLSSQQWEETRSRWREQHQGVSNAHRVAIIERGRWVSTTPTMKDMMFPELRQVSRDEIREAFGIHKHILGIADDVNRAASEAARIDFGTDTVMPRLDRFKQALNNDLLPMFGKIMGSGYRFVYSSPVPHDREADSAEKLNQATVFETYVRAGVAPDDAAQLAGIPAPNMRGITTDATRP